MRVMFVDFISDDCFSGNMTVPKKHAEIVNEVLSELENNESNILRISDPVKVGEMQGGRIQFRTQIIYAQK